MEKDSNLKWDLRFLELAKLISTWSKDPSTKVGAILVNDLRQVVGMGYNGFARGIADTDERLNNREVKYKFVVHAEVNAILQAGSYAWNSILYVYPTFAAPPLCADCCKAALQAGIAGVVGYKPDENDSRIARWKESTGASAEMWKEKNLFCRLLDPPPVPVDDAIQFVNECNARQVLIIEGLRKEIAILRGETSLA